MIRKTLLYWLLLASLILTSCQSYTPTSVTTQSARPTPTGEIQASAQPTLPVAPTTPPKKTLVVCVGQEPQSLYVYGNSARGIWSILEAIYDGPFDTRNFSAQPVILEDLPSLSQGDAVLTPVDVKAGDNVVDANGNLVALAAGTPVTSSGCTGDACGGAWDGKKALQLDQLKVTFKLKPGIQWSDGQPLTAGDSVYSFNLASAPETPVSKNVIDRTVSYKALDNLTVEWLGVPGYVPSQYDTLFWLPLPQHAWGKMKPADLLAAPESTQKPLGWGPYIVDDWKAGDHISLHKNPLYFRAAEGLPKFDNLVFRFLGDQSSSNLAALESGECDVVDATVALDDQLEKLVIDSNAGKIQLFTGQGPEWEHLDFGIKPAAYDDGFNAAKDRPDFFSDIKVRQAFAYCIDRQSLAKTLFFDRTSVPGGYLSPTNPLFQDGLKPLPYDPAAGAKLLDEAGWMSSTSAPSSPRSAAGSAAVPAGTLLEVNYTVTDSPLDLQIAQTIQKDLSGCGIQVKISTVNLGQLYSPGPDGPLFGRQFDLTQFAWQSGSQSPCFLYESSQIPDTQNNWLGANITGFSSQEYDAACQKALQSRPDQADYVQVNQAAESLFARDLPVIPLYYRLKIVAARPDFCGLQMDVTDRSALWGLESFDYGAGCK